MGPVPRLLLFLAPQIVGACNCLVSRSACQDVAASNLVFIGTVEAIQPDLLDSAKPHAHPNWLNDAEIMALRNNTSASGVQRLKDRYLQLLPDLPEEEKLRFQVARSQEELQTVMTWILSQGTRVRFKVKTMFQQKEDSDADSDSAQKDDSKRDKDVALPQHLEIWNDAGDCGVPFQKGETYLVYATNDEETDRLETNICHRTARLTDAGDDLTYLYFFHNGRPESARLDGLITSDIDQLQQNRFHYRSQIKSPVRNVVVELHSNVDTRYTETDAGGRFLFDGLAQGDYQISVFEAGFPEWVHRLSGPLPVRVRAGECAMKTLLVLSGRLGR